MKRSFLLFFWDCLAFSALALLSGCCHGLSSNRVTLPVPTRHSPAIPPAVQALSLKELDDYFGAWETLGNAVQVTPPNPKVTTALPPRPSSLEFPSENYTKTFPGLLNCMARQDLPPKTRKYLELLALPHQQQAILSETYRAVDELQHAKKEALPRLLSSARRLQKFQAKFQKLLPDPNAAAVNAELSSWLQLWDNRDPLDVLPSLWQLTPEPRDIPIVGCNQIAVRFSALYAERPLSATLPEVLKRRRHLWIHQDFATPVVATGRCAYLILPPLPRTTFVFLNGKLLAKSRAGKPTLIPLTAEVLGDVPMQRLGLYLPTKILGEAPLPICLAAGPKPEPGASEKSGK